MTGTEKQIAWAEQIKAEVMPLVTSLFPGFAAKLAGQERAETWINLFKGHDLPALRRQVDDGKEELAAAGAVPVSFAGWSGPAGSRYAGLVARLANGRFRGYAFSARGTLHRTGEAGTADEAQKGIDRALSTARLFEPWTARV